MGPPMVIGDGEGGGAANAERSGPRMVTRGEVWGVELPDLAPVRLTKPEPRRPPTPAGLGASPVNISRNREYDNDGLRL